MFGNEFYFGLWLYILAFALMQLLEQIYHLSPFPDSLVLSCGVLLLCCLSENDEFYWIFPGMTEDDILLCFYFSSFGGIMIEARPAQKIRDYRT